MFDSSRNREQLVLPQSDSFPNEESARFWSELRPNQQHTPESYQLFTKQIQSCRLAAEVADTLAAWNVPVLPEWEKVINQTALQEDGNPAWSIFESVLPEVAQQLREIWRRKHELKGYFKQNCFTVQSDYFGPCEYRLLHGEGEGESKTPTILMPGCLTGAMSLENVSVAAAQLGRNIITCDTAAPSNAGNRAFHAENNTNNWVTPKTAVNTAYTESVELSMATYEEGYNIKNKDQKYNLVGYSTSAAAVLQAALRNPQKVENITLLCPIGLTNVEPNQDENVTNILIGAVMHSLQNLLLGETNQNTKEYFTGYIERQHKRGWNEVERIIDNAAVTDLTEAIYQAVVVQRIPVSVLLGDDDNLFPIKLTMPKLRSMQDKIAETDETAPFDISVLGDSFTHNHIGRDPERTARVLEASFAKPSRMETVKG